MTCREYAPGARWRRIVPLVLLLATLFLALPVSSSAQTQPPSAAQELAEKYEPIVHIQQRPSECSTVGEPYLPAPVEAVFDDPDVKLRQIATDGGSDDPVIMTGPTAQDLAGLDETYYLDFPGNPRLPGCDYEEWFRAKVKNGDVRPTTYARIATQADRPGMLALQYWTYWVFNDFNNKHESDWEMIQLNFDASTPEEALTREPSAIAFAQHGGGESAEWDGEKAQREGNRLQIYPAAGSHATYYEDALWIAWGKNGSGFGCDDIRSPVERVETDVVLIPDTIDPNGEFGWMLFDGRWGERQAWEFNGPTGPNQGSKWTEPISWTDDIRPNSLAVPGFPSVGPGPAGIFCSVSGTVSSFITIFPVAPQVASALSFMILAGLAIPVGLGWRYLAQGIRLYGKYWLVFLPTSVFLLIVSSIGADLDNLVSPLLTSNDGPEDVPGFASLFESSLGIGIHGFQQLLSYALIVPVVVFLTNEIRSGRGVGTRQAWELAIRRFPIAFLAVFIPLLLTGLMAATIILIPLAIYKAVQWLDAPHAVLINGASWREARHVSRRAVKGHWWRTLGMGAGIALFSGVPGPIIGLLFLVLLEVPMEVADLISTLVYLIAFPTAIIASALYYVRVKDELAEAERPKPEPSDDTGLAGAPVN